MTYKNTFIKFRVIFIIFIFLFIGLAILRLNPEFLYHPDCGEYVTLAKAISSGQGYRDISQCGNPDHTKYPFFYPVMLIPWVLLFPENVLAWKCLSILLAVVTLIGIYFFFKPFMLVLKNKKQIPFEIDPGISNDLSHNKKAQSKTLPFIFFSILFLLIIINPTFLIYSTEVMSHIPALCITIWALIFLRHFADKKFEKGKIFNFLIWAFFTSLLMALAFFTRGDGIVLLPTGLVYLFFNGYKKTKSFFCLENIKKALTISFIFIILVIPWIYRDIHVSRNASTSGENYVSQIFSVWAADPFASKITPRLLTKRILLNLKFYFKKGMGIINPLFPFEYHYSIPWLEKIKTYQIIIFLFYSITSLLLILGIWSHLKGNKIHPAKPLLSFRYLSNIDIIILYPFFYLALHLCFTYRQHRYLVPLIPFTFYFLIKGIQWIIDQNETNSKNSIPSNSSIKTKSEKYIICYMRYLISAALILIFVLPAAITSENLIKHNLPLRNKSIWMKAGKWLKENTPSSTVIMGGNELWLWSDRKVVSYDPKCAPWIKSFEQSIKENKVEYLIASVGINNSSDYDHLFYSSTTHNFKPETHIGNLLVYKIDKNTQGHTQKKKKKDFANLVTKYKNILKLYPENDGLHNILGYIYYHKKDYFQSAGEFKKAALIKPDNSIYHFNWGTALLNAGEYEKSLRVFKKTLPLEFAYVTKAILKQNIEIAKMHQEIKINPKNPQNAERYNIIGTIWWQRGSYEKAIAEFKKAIQTDPAFIFAYFNLGLNYESTGYYGKAIEQYVKTLEIDTNFRPAQQRLIVLNNRRLSK